jgi:hypothetical protein
LFPGGQHAELSSAHICVLIIESGYVSIGRATPIVAKFNATDFRERAYMDAVNQIIQHEHYSQLQLDHCYVMAAATDGTGASYARNARAAAIYPTQGLKHRCGHARIDPQGFEQVCCLC